MSLLTFRKVRQELKINILFDLISIYKFSNIYFELKLFKQPFFRISKYKKDNNMNNIVELFPFENIREIIKDECLKHIIAQVPPEIKNIVMIRSGLGETYLLNLYLEQYMQGNNLSYDNTYFVGLRENFGDLFKQYNPLINYKKINLNWDYLSFAVNKDFYSFNDKNIFIYINKDFIYGLMDEYKNTDNPVHYVKRVQDLFGFNPDYVTNKFSPDSNRKIKVLDKLRKDGLNIDNFIFISPDALSIRSLNKSFWNSLTSDLRKKGYDIFYNSKDYSITEAKIAASYSKGIIGMRSGFMETLLELKKPMHVIYTPMLINNMPSDKFKKAHSLILYPYADKNLIFEYPDNREELLIENISGRF